MTTPVEFYVKTDSWPGETSWALVNDCTGKVEKEMPSTDIPQYDEELKLYRHKLCLPDAEWTFTIEDSYGDGICCTEGGGYYGVVVDGKTAASGGNFEYSESFTFGSCPTPEVS